MGSAGGLFAASLGAQGVGTGLSVAQQINVGRAQSQAERQQLEINRQIADIQARDAITRGEREAERRREATRRTIGAQRAAFGAQGVEIGSGSALDIQLDTAAQGAADELTIRNNAWREAMGFRQQALSLGTRGALTGIAARFRETSTIATGGLQFVRGGLGAFGEFRRDRFLESRVGRGG